VGYGSRFFEVRGQLRLDRSVMQVRTLVERDGLNVKALQQQRGALEAPVPLALPALPGAR
jgi:general secretion pathway protein K